MRFGTLVKPGHLRRVILQRNLQLGSLEVSPLQLQIPDSSVGGRPAVPAGADVGGLL